MQNAANLRVTGEASTLAVAIYRATNRFPASERFGLTSQMRRSAVSIGSNIAEGCGRFGNRELVHFLQMAQGSASELEFQAQVAMDLEYLTSATDGAPTRSDRPREADAHTAHQVASLAATVS
jgi:four helix bundle protein